MTYTGHYGTNIFWPDGCITHMSLCVGLGAKSSGHNQQAAAYKTTSCTEGLVAYNWKLHSNIILLGMHDCLTETNLARQLLCKPKVKI